MEKSLVKTDQISAKAAAVTATKTAIPARRAVSASRSGEIGAGCPVAISRRATVPASRLYAARARAITRAKLPNDAIGTPQSIQGRFSHIAVSLRGRLANHFCLHHKLPGCDL